MAARGIGAATTEFVQAAKVQGDALGYDPHYVWVAHPMQDRTDAEIQALAEKHFDEIVAALISQ